MESEDMLTAREAIDAFRNAGLSETTFRKRIKDGKIEKHLPEGRDRGALYPRRQVLAVIGEEKPKKPGRSHHDLKPTAFLRATTQDMPEIAALLETLYKAKISSKKRAAWLEKNPEVAYVLRSEEKIVGCAFLMPLREEIILNSLQMEVKPAIKLSDILVYEPGSHVHLYLRSVGIVQKTVSKKQYKYWSMKLILGIAKSLVDLGSKGVIIEKIYAQGDTQHYQRALKVLGFVRISSPSALHKNFVLDVSTCYEEIVMRYKRALNTWRAQNEEE